MMNNKWVTLLLSLLLVLTAATSVMTLYGQEQVKGPQAPSGNRPAASGQAGDDLREQFPEVDFEAREPGEAKVSAERVKKNSRYDKRRFVSSDPTPRITGTTRVDEGYVPAIPAEQSSVIIIGEVLSAQAHLSNNKSGVYSEFTVRVGEVLKTDGPPPLAQGDEVTVEREGGIVHYPNGHKRLYSLSGQGMPRVGRSYVLFLSAVEGERTYNLLTGYELRTEGVVPIDFSSHFAAYRGYDPTALLEVVRASISQSR